MAVIQYQEALKNAFKDYSYGTHPVELYEPISYLMSLGGKRLRPALTLMGYHLFKDDWESALKPAMAVEVFHNFSLMHDDIMDEAPLRRGQPTVHEKWNRDVAILSGDVMLVAAYELLSEAPAHQLKTILKRFNRTAAEVCEGQQMDMNFASRSTVTEHEYIEMIKLKTSVLLGFALELGGLVADQPPAVIEKLYSIGVHMGIGFQLKDDLLDVYGDPEKFGKQVGGDIIENKKTWLMLKAIEQCKSADLNQWLTKSDFDKTEKVKAVTAIFDSLNIKKQAEEKIDQYFSSAMKSIDELPISDTRKEIILNFGKNLQQREY